MFMLLSCIAAKSPPPGPAVLSSQRGGAELVVRGTPEQRAQGPQADLVLFYASELGGSLETCGCPDRPRGSTARIATYLNAARTPEQPSLLLMGGFWLEDTMGNDGLARPEVPVMNRYVAQALDMLQVDAANVSYKDLPGLLALPSRPEWALSTNITGLPSTRILQAGDITVGVVAITRYGLSFEATPGHVVEDPYAPAAAAIAELSQRTDVQVLLAYGASEVAADLARNLPELDVVIDANMHRGFFEPERVGEAIWVRSHYQTMRLGELRLNLLDSGGVELVMDRKIDMDPELLDEPQMAALAARALQDIEAARIGSSATPTYVLRPTQD